MMIVRAALLGAATGMRSMTAPALLSRELAHRPQPEGAGGVERLLADPIAVGLSTAAMVGELVADKLPGIPSRLDAGPLLARVVIGAFCGSILCRGTPNQNSGGVAGGVGALLGAYALFHARQALTRDGGFPDLPVALAEDVLSHYTARVALQS